MITWKPNASTSENLTGVGVDLKGLNDVIRLVRTERVPDFRISPRVFVYCVDLEQIQFFWVDVL